MSSPTTSVQAKTAVAGTGLRYVSDDAPGITRRRCGRGFVYRDANGRRVVDPDVLSRIRALAVPPAWTSVWICPQARGHLQATGRDARGRKQYRYHARWSALRSNGKFDRIVAFGNALPRLRRRLRGDLAQPGVSRRKVVATVVAVLADTLVRVGNEGYARSNGSYGLTTLRSRHVSVLARGRLRLRFKAKGGIAQEALIDNPRLARVVRRCQQLPGQLLFQYRDEDGRLRPVASDDVNDYLREAIGEDFSAKDFRTWGGTLAACRALAARNHGASSTVGDERAVCRQAVADVAARLGNTVAVCRASYIDPCVFDGWRDGSLQRCVGTARGERQWEQAVLRFLRARHRRAAERR